MDTDERIARDSVVAAARDLDVQGLNRGTSGNVSVRFRDGLLITPSGLPTARMRPEDIVPMGLDGTHPPDQKPSSEWRFHRDILAHRPEIGAVVHAHPVYCTAFAMCGRDIPAVHYMIAAFGAHCPLRALRGLRHGRTVRARPRGPDRPQRLPSGEPRHDRGWREPGEGTLARRRAGDALPPLRGRAPGRRTGDPVGPRDPRDRGALPRFTGSTHPRGPDVGGPHAQPVHPIGPAPAPPASPISWAYSAADTFLPPSGLTLRTSIRRPARRR